MKIGLILVSSLLGITLYAGTYEGLPVAEGDYPELLLTRSGDIACTGTMVGSKAILLAAHCIDQKNPLVRVFYKGMVYKAVGVTSDAEEEKQHDLAIAVLIDKFKEPEPASVLTAPLQAKVSVRLYSFGCDEDGELSPEYDTLRMGDTLVTKIMDTSMIIKQPSTSTACFSRLGAPLFTYSSKDRFVAGSSPKNAHDAGPGVIKMLRMDSAETRALFQRVSRLYGVKICGYNIICENNSIFEP